MPGLNWEKKPEEVTLDSMEQRRRRYEEYAVYVTDDATRRTMLRGLERVAVLLKAKEPIAAKSHLEIVKHAYAMARYRNLVLKYRSTFGSVVTMVQLFVLCAVFAYGHYQLSSLADQTSYRVFLAVIGGGLGGVAVVISGLLGIQIQTAAIVHRNVWYILKPVSGCIMGLVTYLAVEVGAQAIGVGTPSSSPAPTPGTTKYFAVFLIGFLGGFFETFANKALLRAAKLDEPVTASTPNKPQGTT